MHPLDIQNAQDGLTARELSAHKAAGAGTPELAGLSLLCVTTPAALELLNQRRWQFLGPYEGQCGRPACRCAHRDVIDFTSISVGTRQDRPASGTKCADGESVVDPIDYFMAIFTGMCIGLAGMAYVLG
jgi:hypothetical protein